MLQSRRLMIGLLALTLTAGACLADNPPEPGKFYKLEGKFYKLEFVVKEVSASKVVNSRTYLTIVSVDSKGEIRAGSKIPFTTASAAGPQFQYIDVGINIDAQSLREIGDKLAFNLVADVSSVAEGGDQTRPTIRQNRWNSMVIIPLKKPTVVFSSENLDAKTQLQIEVTATPMP